MKLLRLVITQFRKSQGILNKTTHIFPQQVRRCTLLTAARTLSTATCICQREIACRSLATTSSGSIDSAKEILESTSQLDSVTYERVCAETLNALCDYFEELVENTTDSDVAYGDGVLTVKLGNKYGTYVINRQTPNKQIWLSSPTSGPKRYDFVCTDKKNENGKWIYKHTGESLHGLLQHEIKNIFKDSNVDFAQLPYGAN